MTKHLITVTATITLIVIVAFYQAIFQALLMVGYSAAALLALAGLGGLFFGGWYLRERIGMLRAQRRLADRDSHALVVTSEYGVFIRETDKSAVWLQLHQMPQWRINGIPADPTPAELATYQAWLTSRATRPTLPGPLLLDAPQAIPELLPILDSAQRVLIIGASDSGKTNLLQWVVSRRTGAIVVIDPHSSPNKWPKSARVVGAGSNHPEIETTLDNLIGVMVQRYKEISAGLVREGEHPKLTIIIDEWMSIAYQCQNAQDVMVRLLTESRKAAMSVIIGSHSERVKSLGLDGKGDLRDGFLFVRLWLESTGERRATYDYGRGERPCVLPGKFANVTEGPVIEIEAITEAKPTEQEQKVLDLKATGASYNEICRQIYGTAGGKQIQLVKDILAKYQVPG